MSHLNTVRNHNTGGHWASGAAGDRPITGVSIDSRTLAAGDLFVALVGPTHDGHDFVGKALEGRPPRKVIVVPQRIVNVVG